MPVGSDVCAARAGVIVTVVTEHEGNGPRAPNNLIVVAHGDGTFGWYLHLRRDGSYVRLGERVRQGQRIGASGNVGRSASPHLHFHVTDKDCRVMPVTFRDVSSGRGIPRTFRRYTSGNAPPEE